MVPVVLEQGRGGITGPLRDRDRPGPQLILAILMVVAFGAVVIARFSGVGTGPGLVAAGSPTPSATVSTTPATPRPTPTPSTSPSASPSASPTQPPPTPTPTASTSGRTYTVQAGDTLSGIAARFGTTVRELVALNGIENPSRIRIGLELKLP
jgi:LysM repeat protein